MGYFRQFLKEVKVEVNQTIQTHGAYKVEKDNHPVVPFVGTYSQALEGFHSELESNFQQARNDCEALKYFRVISAFRRNKNLKDI